MPAPQRISSAQLVDSYDAILLDAYGVLVDSSGPLDNAIAFIDLLNQQKKNYFVVTNDASKLPSTALKRYRGFGLHLREDAIISSGSLLKPYFEREGLEGARCVVLGTHDSHAYVEMAGGEIVTVKDNFDVVVIGDEAGFPFLELMDEVLSALSQRFAGGDRVRLILPNPDLIYPRTGQGFGFASGMMALMLERALALRFPASKEIFFERLGKPFTPIFEEAFRRSGTMNMVMVGDQLETDIRGANRFGIASALIATGVTTVTDAIMSEETRPTFIINSLACER